MLTHNREKTEFKFLAKLTLFMQWLMFFSCILSWVIYRINNENSGAFASVFFLIFSFRWYALRVAFKKNAANNLKKNIDSHKKFYNSRSRRVRRYMDRMKKK